MQSAALYDAIGAHGKNSKVTGIEDAKFKRGQ